MAVAKMESVGRHKNGAGPGVGIGAVLLVSVVYRCWDYFAAAYNAATLSQSITFQTAFR
jgi:hypothetical protein